MPAPPPPPLGPPLRACPCPFRRPSGTPAAASVPARGSTSARASPSPTKGETESRGREGKSKTGERAFNRQLFLPSSAPGPANGVAAPLEDSTGPPSL